jgi:hypothetical protein
MNLPSPSRVLDAAASARLYGTLREGFAIVLGVAIIASSSLISGPQEWIIVGMGTLTFALGFCYLWRRIHRNRGEGRDDNLV